MKSKPFMYETAYIQPQPPRRRRRWPWIALLVIVVGYSLVALLWPAPSVVATPADNLNLPTQSVSLAWPAAGQASIGAVGYGILDNSPNQTPVPLASTAKIMMALAVQKQKPLAVGQDGPMITFSAEDEASYQRYVFEGGSTVPVKAGQQMSERKALEAMLVPSANNIAEALARWAFGSLPAYSDFADQYAKELGATNSTFADPSGFAPATTGTAHDMVVLGEKLMHDPVLAEIVKQPRIDLGNNVSLPSTNSFLVLKPGTVGIKTGHTDQSGGCYVYALSHNTEDGQPVTIISAVLAAPNLVVSMDQALALAQTTASHFKTAAVIKASQPIGYYSAPWGSQTTAVAKDELKATYYEGLPLEPQIQLDELSSAAASQTVGSINIHGQDPPVTETAVSTNEFSGPSWWWRLTHPWLLW